MISKTTVENSGAINAPKVVIVGAGSLFFGRKAIWGMNHMKGLRGGTLCLIDTNAENLDRSVRLARMVAEYTGSGTRIEGYSDYREALPKADFVILSFSRRNAHFRRIDCDVSAKYGIRMCSGDTIGPGGVFRAIREFPTVLEIAKAIEVTCPQAWLINYINPTATMGIGLSRHSRAKLFALCDIHHLPKIKLDYLKIIGEPEDALADLDLKIAGVNHFTWMLKAELRGEDIMGRILDAHRHLGQSESDEGYAKQRFNHRITAELADVFGVIPTCPSHTKEYVPHYQGRGPVPASVPALSVFDCDEREKITRKSWADVDDYLLGKIEIGQFDAEFGPDHATDIMNTMVAGDGRRFFVNRLNGGCRDGQKPVGNLPAEAFLELECEFDASGPVPVRVGDFPLGVPACRCRFWIFTNSRSRPLWKEIDPSWFERLPWTHWLIRSPRHDG